MGEANKKFRNLDVATPGRVYDTRIRYVSASNEQTPCNNLFFYDAGAPISYINDKMNIVFKDRSQDGPCTIAGQTNVGSNRIVMYNMLKAITEPCLSNGNDFSIIQQYSYARYISHELGHVFGLSHAFSCCNPCIGIDMDITEECADANDIDYCHPSFGASPVGHCQGMGASKNFMGYNTSTKVITPCQLGLMLQYILDNQPSFVRLCDDPDTSPRLVSGDEVWNDFTRIMDRDIIVQTGSTLTINCEVYMGEDKRITVQRGAKLVVDGGKISNLCDDTFWEGIIVHGNNSQEQPNLYDILQSDDAGVVYIKDSRIEYATRAVRASGDGVSGYSNQVARWGGLIIAENSYFTNNKVSVGFMKYTFSNKSRFINCTFEQLPNLSYSNSYGVSIWACQDILFEGNTFTDLGKAGIEGSGFTAKILTGNNFINLFPAIWLRSSSSSQLGVNPIEIGGGQSGNTFENCPTGIYATATNQLNKLVIKNNSFIGGSVGIYIDGPSNFTIDQNQFGGEQVNEGMDQGILTINAGTQYNYASCNNFENVCIPIDSEGSNRNFSFLGNEFINASSNVRVRGNNSIPGTVRYSQGSSKDTPNNCFGSGVDIETIGITESFLYYIPDDSNAPACLSPVTSGNNYTTPLGFSDFDVCGEVELFSSPPYNAGELAAARDSVAEAKNMYAATSASANASFESSAENQMAKLKLDKWNEIKDIKLRWLIEDRIRQNDFNGAEFMANGEESLQRKKLQYLIRMAGKNYEGAKNALLTIQNEQNLLYQDKLIIIR